MSNQTTISDTTDLPPGFQKPEWWDAMWQSVIRHVTAQKPHGCICPPGSEATCKGWNCPRRPIGVQMP